MSVDLSELRRLVEAMDAGLGDGVSWADGQRAFSAGVTALRNAAPQLLDEIERLRKVEEAARAVCGKEMEIDGITFRQQDLIDALRKALEGGK